MTHPPTSVSHDEATDLKLDGLQLSLLDMLDDDEEAFMSAVRAIRPGTEFSANTLRPVLDAREVPESRRAGLMRKACLAGLAEPVTTTVAGTVIPTKIPSTGRSAKGAYIILYRRRPAAPVEGR